MSYPVGPCVLYGRLLLITWLLGAAVACGHAWHAARAPLGALLLLGLSAGWACRAWRAAPSGRLCWAGADGWAWQSGDQPDEQPGEGAGEESGQTSGPADLERCAPVVVWRGGHHLLLHWAAGPRRLRWLWIERRRDPARWEAFCRAVQAR